MARDLAKNEDDRLWIDYCKEHLHEYSEKYLYADSADAKVWKKCVIAYMKAQKIQKDTRLTPESFAPLPESKETAQDVEK